VRRFTIFVSEDELEALKVVAEKELRDYRIQARLLLKSELENRGLLERDKGKKIGVKEAVNDQPSHH
jgi:hypothetical protein